MIFGPRSLILASLTLSPCQAILQALPWGGAAVPSPRSGHARPRGGGCTVAVVCLFAGSVDSYSGHFAAWVVAIRPERCPHCGSEHTILWGSYLRWVYTTTDRFRIRIERVRCCLCGVTDALLPSFLHLFRRYLLPLIQKAITLALDAGLWSDALADAVGPYHAPAPSTVREWLWSFVLSADWLLPWLQRSLSVLEPLSTLDPGRPPLHLQAIRHPTRRAAFTRAWLALRLAEALYATSRRRQPELAFGAETLLAFLASALGAARRIPRILWPQAPAQAP
jgi:hypothetical protein